MLTLGQVVAAISWVDTVVADLVSHEQRDKILNERFYHHMFSSYLASTTDVESTWTELMILPEYPTNHKFSRANIRLNDPTYTRMNALNAGRSGNLDFFIPGEPPIALEWKGPKICSEKDLAEVFIKLLNRNWAELKIIAAVFLTKSGMRGHARELKTKLTKCLKFACNMHGITSLPDQNIHAYIRSRHEKGCCDIWWGPINNADLT